MLLFKFGLLAIMGKKFYSSFLLANLVIHSTQNIKSKLNRKLEVVK